jgi:hypothetical protein
MVCLTVKAVWNVPIGHCPLFCLPPHFPLKSAFEGPSRSEFFKRCFLISSLAVRNLSQIDTRKSYQLYHPSLSRLCKKCKHCKFSLADTLIHARFNLLSEPLPYAKHKRFMRIGMKTTMMTRIRILTNKNHPTR